MPYICLAVTEDMAGGQPVSMENIKACDYHYIEHRITQVRYLGERLEEAAISFVKPVGGHAIFLDAKKFLPHIPQEEFLAQ